MGTTPRHILMTRFPYESVLSGEEWHTITLAETLRKRGIDITFAGSCPVLLDEFSKRDIKAHKVDGGILPVSKGALLRFLFTWPLIRHRIISAWKKLHASHAIDAVYMLSLTEKLLLTPYLIRHRIPVLWVEHQRFGKWFYKNPLLPLYRKLATQVQIITVSEDHKKQLLQANIPEEHIHVVTNGIDTTFFTPNGNAPWKKEGRRLIGTVARLSYDKGVDILIRVFSETRKLFPDLHLIIQGEGLMKDELVELTHKLGQQDHIQFFTPYQEVPRTDMPGFYRSLDVFVLPSRLHDPFGLVVAEALSCGTPTILTSACGIAKQIEHGTQGMIIDPGSHSQLKSALTKVLSDPQLHNTLKIQGPLCAKDHFSLEHMTDHYLSLLFPTSSSTSHASS